MAVRNPSNLRWLAGWLEGEGCFSLAKTGKPYGKYTYPRIVGSSTDEDVVQRAADLFGRKLGGPLHNRAYPGSKAMYVASVTGTDAAGWMMTLYPLMGARRKAKIREVLGAWQSARA